MTKRVIGALAALGVLSSGMAAYAATATDTMGVTATVASTCTVTIGDLAFGTLTYSSANFAADATSGRLPWSR